MDGLNELKRTWEGLARTDPLWAICVDSERKNNKWNVSDFFLSGEIEIGIVLDYLTSLGISVDKKGPVLDFGCGVGRLTQAMANHFDLCYGVDISPTMIELANEFNKRSSTCNYLVNDSETLSLFENDQFSFIYTSIVLQHIKPKYTRVYLQELIRILKPNGVLVFQIVDSLVPMVMRIRKTLKLRVRGYRVADFLGLMEFKPEKYNMSMHCVPERVITRLVSAAGARIIDLQITNSAAPGFNGNLQYLSGEPATGYVSKQYCVTKG